MSGTSNAARREGAATGTPPARDSGQMDSRQRHEAAAYIASLLAGLRQIADGAELEKLVAALDNAFYEAFTLTQTKPQAPAPAQGEPADKA
jgi:hypothetical protein